MRRAAEPVIGQERRHVRLQNFTEAPVGEWITGHRIPTPDTRKKPLGGRQAKRVLQTGGANRIAQGPQLGTEGVSGAFPKEELRAQAFLVGLAGADGQDAAPVDIEGEIADLDGQELGDAEQAI